MTTTNDPSANSRWKSIVKYAVAACAACVVLFLGNMEFQARSNFSKSVSQLRTAIRASEEGQPAVLAARLSSLVTGSPTRTSRKKQQSRLEIFEWRGVLGTYTLRVKVGIEGEVLSFDTLEDTGEGSVVAMEKERAFVEYQRKVRKQREDQAATRKAATEGEKTISSRRSALALPTLEEQAAGPGIVMQVQKSFDQTPTSPLPATSEVSTTAKVIEARRTLMMKRYVEGYTKFGHRDPSWDDHVREFLTEIINRELDPENSLSRDELIAKGRRITLAGCRDPVFMIANAKLIFGLGNSLQTAVARPRNGHQLVDMAYFVVGGFEQFKYPARVAYRGSVLGASLAANEYLQTSVDRTPSFWNRGTDLLVELIPETASGEFAKGERRLLLEELTFELDGLLRNYAEPICTSLSYDPKADPWLVNMLLAREHVKLGWKARGTRFANEVTAESMQEFHVHLKRARVLLLEAWNLRPQNPEAAAELIQVTMAVQGIAGETSRFWFDQSVKAQLDYPPAYKNLLWALWPRWGGSHAQMLEFGRECLATGRFDTQVPWEFHNAVVSIAFEADDERVVYSQEGVYEDYQKLFTGYDARDDAEMKDVRTSQRACLAYLAGRQDEAGKLLEQLGDRGSQLGFDAFGQSLEIVREELDPTTDHVQLSLKRAGQLHAGGKSRSAEFSRRLRSVLKDLPEVEVAIDGKPRWKSLTLNEHGQGFDAIRFTSPLKQPADMHWIFSASATGNWNILPARGKMRGFSTFWQEYDVRIDGVELPPQNTTVFQPLTGGLINPGETYIVWFAALSAGPCEIQLAINLLPMGSHVDNATAEEIAKIVGTKIHFPEFEPTEEGRQAALRHARSLYLRGLHESRSFRRTLSSVSAALPQVEVTTGEDKDKWTTLTLNRSGTQFSAFRFTSPLDTDADLRLILSRPTGKELRGTIILRDGGTLNNVKVVVRENVKLPNVALSPKNRTAFISVLGGQIKPGKEYLFWISLEEKTPFDVKVTVSLQPTE